MRIMTLINLINVTMSTIAKIKFAMSFLTVVMLLFASCEKPIHVKSVSINKTSLELYPGENATLIHTILPENADNQDITWSSSSPDVASVAANGLVIALKTGETKITVTTIDGNATATCTVFVKQPVSGISLDQTSLVLKTGLTYSLKVTISPEDAFDKNVTWSSSNTDVATVNENGLVTAVAPGKASITVSSDYKNKTANCEVVVKAPVSEITLDKESLTLYTGETSQLKCTIKPEDVYDKTVTWSSSASSIAKVSANGLITAIASGEATITVASNDTDVKATCKVIVRQSVAGISLDNDSLILNIGDNYQFKYTITPQDAYNKNVTWTSSASNIVSVNTEGKVTANAEGKSTITVTTENGKKTDKCVVIVQNPNEARLNSLKLYNSDNQLISLSPTFNSDVFNYSISLYQFESQTIKVEAEAMRAGSNITGNGNITVSATTTSFKVTVTSSNGQGKKEYVINITRSNPFNIYRGTITYKTSQKYYKTVGYYDYYIYVRTSFSVSYTISSYIALTGSRTFKFTVGQYSGSISISNIKPNTTYTVTLSGTISPVYTVSDYGATYNIYYTYKDHTNTITSGNINLFSNSISLSGSITGITSVTQTTSSASTLSEPMIVPDTELQPFIIKQK